MKIKLLLIFILFVSVVQAQESNSFFNSKGKLIIIGGGDIPDTIFTLFAASIGGKDQPIVVIPTATEDEEYIKTGGHLKKFTDRGFTHVSTIHTREKSAADLEVNLNLMRNARGLFFGGGDQALLEKAYAGTQLHREMFALLNRRGVIMGTSAGASIMGSLLIGGDHRKTPHVKVDFPKGLSFMNNTAIDQHVLVRNRQFDLIPVLEARPVLLGIAIDESTAAVVEGESISVAGNSYVMIYDQHDWQRQQKEWGRVYRPFQMMRGGMKYNLKSGSIKK